MDPTFSINKGLIYNDAMQSFIQKNGLRGKNKVGDIVLPDNRAEDFYDVIIRYHRKTNNMRKGNLQIQDV